MAFSGPGGFLRQKRLPQLCRGRRGYLGGMLSIDSIVGDLRLAVRALARDRGFTAASILTFALCLGANLALFAVVNAVLLRPLPYPNADQLVAVFNTYPKAGVDRAGSSVPHYLERRTGVASFSNMAAFREGGVTLGESGSTERMASMDVTPSFFRTLGVSAALGRTFAEEEGVYGKNEVLILSDGLWRQNYGADPGVIGRKIRVNGLMPTIIGVMPPGFRFGTSNARLWAPLCFSDDDRKADQRHSNNMSTIARLRPGATVMGAQAQLDALNHHALDQDPYAKLVVDAGFRTRIVNLHNDFVAQARPALLLLQAGVFCLLLIGSVNLANLFLVRASGRSKELSIRQVLGAGRLQIARQLVTETLVLSVAGGLLGLGLGWAGVRGLELLGADRLPHFAAFSLDGRVCLVGFAASVLAGFVLAVPVLWQNLHGNLARSLSVESRGGTTARSAHRLRHGLIVIQFALAFTLLAGAGLLGLSFMKVLSVDPGFRSENLLTGSVPLPWDRYKEDKQREAFTESLGRDLQALPGVLAVGFSTTLPFSGYFDNNAVSIEGQPPAPGESLRTHFTSGVTGAYFAAMGIPLVEGRLLKADDSSRALKVCVVDQDVARRYWPGKSAVGHRLFKGPPDKTENAFTIVGVVGATKTVDLADTQATGSIYFPYGLYAGLQVNVLLRTVQAPAALGSELRAAVLRIDPELPLDDVKTMGSRLDQSLLTRRSPMVLAGIFAGVSVVLAAVGIYGVLAYAVEQRRREIGVRMALGALPNQILSQFLFLGTRLVVAGSLLGAIGGWLTGRAMSKLLFGVGSAHPAVFVGTAAVLALVSLAACLAPAVRAARVPPMEALRAE